MSSDFQFRALLALAAFAFGNLLAAGAMAQTSGVVTPSGATATVNRNVYTAGGEVRSAAPVLGDYTAAGGNVIVDQPVSGDVGLAGGAVVVSAPVADDLRVAAGDIKIDAAVGGELFAVGGKISLGSAAVVGRGARLYASKISVDGRIEGDLQANADRIVINGEVRGDASVHASHVELGPNAKIGGVLHYVSDHELVKAEGATVVGAVSREEKAASRSHDRRAYAAERLLRLGRWIGGVAAYLVVLAVAALLMLAAPGPAAGAAQRIRSRPWAALGLGLATLLAVPVLAVLLFITVLGIPLGLAVLALFPAVLLLGFVVSVLFFARALPPAFRLPAPKSFGATMGWFAAALLLVMVVARIPFLGALLMLFVGLAGLGAGVLELYSRRKRPPAANGGARAGTPAAATTPPGDDMAGAQA